MFGRIKIPRKVIIWSSGDEIFTMKCPFYTPNEIAFDTLIASNYVLLIEERFLEDVL